MYFATNTLWKTKMAAAVAEQVSPDLTQDFQEDLKR